MDPYPHPTSAAVTKVMKANRRTDTVPEVRLRSALHALGLRFRKDYPVRTERRLVRPDVVFPRQRIAVFLDGCFWHACPTHGNTPKVNTPYWQAKLERNRVRDTDVNLALGETGWSVLRFWEHEDVTEVAETVAAAVRSSEPQIQARKS